MPAPMERTPLFAYLCGASMSEPHGTRHSPIMWLRLMLMACT